MMKKLDHIGIAVRSIQETLKVYEGAFGLKATPMEEVPERGAKLVFLTIGDVKLELVEPYQKGEGPVARFLEKRGPGLHHVAFSAADIESEMSRLAKEGIAPMESAPRLGARGHKVCFIHPDRAHGVLVELVGC